MSKSGTIRVGIGGWTFPPWRGGVFYPEGLTQSKEIEYATRQVTAIEINGTFYGLQKPTVFQRWRDAAPENFVYSLKAVRFATQRKNLAEGKDQVTRFLESGFTELGDKLGPVLWQLPPFVQFEPDGFAAFLDLLPKEQDGRKLRHVVEARHESFADPAAVALLKERNIALCVTDTEKHPRFQQVTADFTYARLQDAKASEPTGYAPKELDAWAKEAKDWARTGDVFVFMINGHKEHAPAAARALLDRVPPL